jgi:hypothetical protein
MKNKLLSISLLLFLLVIGELWLYAPIPFFQNIVWAVYVLAVPIGYCALIVVAKSPVEKHLQKILFISLGVVISLLLNREFSFCLFVENLLATLVGATITFFLTKFISNK